MFQGSPQKAAFDEEKCRTFKKMSMRQLNSKIKESRRKLRNGGLKKLA